LFIAMPRTMVRRRDLFIELGCTIKEKNRKKHPATARKYSVVSKRVSLVGPSLSTGLKSPVDSPKYVTTEVTAREKITTFKILTSFEGAKLKPNDARAQAVVNSNSYESQFEALDMRLADRRLKANHLLTKWYTKLKVAHPRLSLKTGILLASAFGKLRR